ncbi:scm-like with four MBT domains protein 1 isoform X1 [Kogia breviceps]|uniref:scm-like with four MBT domains protein 1 isoform X1 n=1 Tax=Kogia breviceps TaxID=27615 RepID=UPI002795DA28|nr:scm-like with four MBT domains protein 1 isoform X1 [Kogia breviceps]XP_058931969.1 scm-like with four MBT domains protein 1 isoform X1 [Kogia breviceps]XP_058931970.1 scm-like with four MBT domains protein 1 isoform X1 [Kogia breviceps]
MNGEQQIDADAGSGVEEVELSWEDYLEETGSTAVPYGSFKHVDTRLQNGFAPGMKLEVVVKTNPETYWVATIITTCEQLLLLRYDGYGEDRRADFWCDIRKADLYPIGWCEQNEKTLEAPEGDIPKWRYSERINIKGWTKIHRQMQIEKKAGVSVLISDKGGIQIRKHCIRDKVPDRDEFLRQTLMGACSPPVPLLEGLRNGRNPLDLIAPGSRLECQAFQESLSTWIVTVVDNIGGRLKLRYEGLGSSDNFEHWLYYLDPFLHHVGWAAQQGYELQPPSAIRHLKTEVEWQEILAKVKEEEEEPLPSYLFKDKQVIGTHSFSVNMKLEAVDPWSPFGISPATIVKVFDEKYFLVEMDDLQPENRAQRSFVCHADSPGIFPVQWGLKNGLHISPPPGYPGQDFDWADYLKQCGAEAAPQRCFPPSISEHEFKENMKLEAVNPLLPEEVCVATITAVRGSYLWLQLEGSKKPIPEFIVNVESMDIFPLGWCETNGHPLSTPRRARVHKQRKVAVVQPEKQIPSSRTVHEGLKNQELSSTDSVMINGKYCCPKIYFNHRCFSGPYLNKGRIAELPQCVGPGNCVLVLREVLTLLINAAYKPSRVLRELQLDKDSVWHGCGEVLKAKYKGKSYRATVEIVKTADRVTEFCRQTCIKLECCPNLFGPRMVLDKCSENCSVLTKTKYTHYYGKKKNKRIGRPPGGHSNLACALKKASKRRKRRKNVFVHKKKRSSASVDNTPAGSPQGSGGEDEDDPDEGDDDSLSEGSTSEQQDELQEESEMSEKKSCSSSPTQSEISTSLPPDRQRRKRELRTFSFSDDENKPPSPKEIRIEVSERLHLDSNPLKWSVADVVRFIRSTDCAPLARIFLDQEIDGQALLLLTLPTVQECMDLKLGPAIKLCHHIERIKFAFYEQFAN